MKFSHVFPVVIATMGSLVISVAAETAPKAELPDTGFSVKFMDPSISHAEDFAKFAAGGWYARTQIPADKSRWGGFNELAERNWAILHHILVDTAAAPGDRGSIRQKVGDFFASATDVATIDGLG